VIKKQLSLFTSKGVYKSIIRNLCTRKSFRENVTTSNLKVDFPIRKNQTGLCARWSCQTSVGELNEATILVKLDASLAFVVERWWYIHVARLVHIEQSWFQA
jgi:hypothetical protein